MVQDGLIPITFRALISVCVFFPQIKKGLFVGLIHSGKSYVIVAIDLEWWLFHIIPDTVKKTNKS